LYEPSEAARTVEKITGRPSPARQTSYRERRKQLLLALLHQYADPVDNAAEEIGAFFDHLRQVGVRGLGAEQLDDPDYVYQAMSGEEPAKEETPVGAAISRQGGDKGGSNRSRLQDAGAARARRAPRTGGP
jgi:hypothetical protein